MAVAPLLGHAEIWGDGSGGAKALTAVLAQGSAGTLAKPEFRVGTPSELICEVTITGGPPTMNIMLEASFTDGRWDDVTALCPPFPTETGLWRLTLPESGDYRLSLADTAVTGATCLVTALSREPRPASPGSNTPTAIGGGEPEGAAPLASFWPVRVAAVVKAVLSTLTDGRTTHLFTDLLGRLRTRDASFDDLGQVLNVAVTNLVSRGPWELIASALNQSGPGNHYYPVDSGNGAIAMDKADELSLEIIGTDMTYTVEAWLGDGDDWADVVDVTPLFIDATTGTSVGASMATGAGATARFLIGLADPAPFTHFRVKGVSVDATNATEIRALRGKR